MAALAITAGAVAVNTNTSANTAWNAVVRHPQTAEALADCTYPLKFSTGDKAPIVLQGGEDPATGEPTGPIIAEAEAGIRHEPRLGNLLSVIGISPATNVASVLVVDTPDGKDTSVNIWPNGSADMGKPQTVPDGQVACIAATVKGSSADFQISQDHRANGKTVAIGGQNKAWTLGWDTLVRSTERAKATKR